MIIMFLENGVKIHWRVSLFIINTTSSTSCEMILFNTMNISNGNFFFKWL